MDSRVAPSQVPFQSKKYEWLEYFGGNMADVYLAREVRTERTVIIKVLKAELCNESELQLRFAQEARLACQCQHPNIVSTFYADEEDGRPYIAMEYLQGETIRALMQRGGLETQEQAVWIGLQLALALGYLQTAQIVHRDLKPDNVVVDQSLCAKLLDFGVARLKDSRLTEFGVRIGTLKYMSPEQVKSEALTFSSDMYAFGVLLFEMLTLQLPYKAQGMEEYFDAILNKEPNLDLLQEVKVPDEVAGVIKRCLEKEPAKRFGSFGEIATLLRPFVLPERLEQFAQPSNAAQMAQTVIAKPEPVVTPEKPPPKSRLPVLWGGIAAAVLMAVIAIWFVMRRPPEAVLSPPAVTTGERVPKSAVSDMVLVDGGPALLGAGAKPVTVKTFYIDRTEVTNTAYLAFCRETGRGAPAGTQQTQGDYPVVNVSLDDAEAFAGWAHKRLPSADEWEKAARGAQGQKFPWGNEWRADAANLPPDRAAAKKAKLAPVTSFASGASPYGALNMVGNAWEWVNTTAVPDDAAFKNLAKLFSPPLARAEVFYQTKGGSFRFYAIPKGQEADLLWDHSPMPARARENDLGFRCAKDP